jgi:ornithine cyclodeaminase/alanine dehydrogenase-like protein (mu-crystallin family)
LIYLDEEAVGALLRWDDLIAAMEHALVAYSRGATLQPMRMGLTIEEQRRYLGIMPAVVGDVMGLKFVAFYPVNAGTEFPTHNATIVLYRTATAEPLAAMDGRLITEMRTAAVSAAITKYLAPEGAQMLAILGSGVQAHSHLQALSRVCRGPRLEPDRGARGTLRPRTRRYASRISRSCRAWRGRDRRRDRGPRSDIERRLAEARRPRECGRILPSGLARAG